MSAEPEEVRDSALRTRPERITTVFVLLLLSMLLSACSPTPFGYVLDPMGTAMAPAQPVVITKIVTPTPKIVVVTPRPPTATRHVVPASTPVPALTASVVVENQLPVSLYFTLHGPVDRSFTVPANDTYTVSLAPGSYLYSVEAYGFQDHMGSVYFESGITPWKWSKSP